MSRPRAAAVLMNLATVVWLHCQGGPRRVSDLSLELKALRPTVLVQESLPVTTSVVNHGTSVQTGPAADGPSPFVYQLRPSAGGETRVVSSDLAMAATSPGTPQADPPLPYEIGPNSSLPRREDIAAIAVRPFAPASYAVTVSTNYPHPLGPSAAVNVQVVPPRVVVAAAVVDPSYDRFMAFAHTDADGSFPVLALHSEAAGAQAAVFLRAATKERWAKPDSIAVSVPGGHEVVTRWVAWTAGGTLLATTDWEPSRAPSLLRANLPGAGARLVSSGFCFDDHTGLFFLLEGATLHAYRFSEKAIEKAWSATLAGGTPERTLIRYAGNGRGEGAVQLVWLSNEGGKRRLMLQSWHARNGGVALPAKALSELALPVLAWHMPSAGETREFRLLVVSGPVPDGRFACLGFQLEANTERVPTLRIPAPPSPAQQWSVTAAGDGTTVVAAHDAGTIHSMTSANATWRTVAEHVSVGSFFDVYANYERAYVQWLDPAFGFRYARLSM